MSRSRRRRRRFGSVPEVHLKTARQAARGARWWLKDLRRKLHAKDCLGALDALVTANRMSATATSERRGAGKTKAMYQARTLNAAMLRFHRRCVLRYGMN